VNRQHLLARLAAVGGARPELQIHHRTGRLRNGVGAPSTGALAKPDPLKRALRQQREQLGLSPRQHRKALKAARRAASTGA
jgi:hypothetical protein